MTSRMLAQLSFVAERDAAACRHEYEWPPVTPTAEEQAQADHLDSIADALWTRACAAGFTGGTDAAFDTHSEP